MTTKYTLQDLVDTAVLLRSLKSDLTDIMGELCDEWIDEVKQLCKRHQSKEIISQDEIDGMVEWHNDICDEEAYPSLLPLVQDSEKEAINM